MDERALLEQVLSGDAGATRRLVGALMPVVHARVARTLVRRRGGSGRDARQEVEVEEESVESVCASTRMTSDAVWRG